MADSQGESQNFSSPAQPVETSLPAQQAPAPVEVERTFKQSEVNDIVGRARSEAVDRYKRDSSIASHQQPHQQNHQAQTPQYRSEDDIRRLAAQETERLRQEWIQESHRTQQQQEAERIAKDFFIKVDAGEGGRETFDKLVQESGVELQSIPYHVQLASMVDNTRDVMTELLNNPAKLANLQSMIDMDLRAGRQPNIAMREIKRLSQSIKDNGQANNFKSPNEPLSQLRPSNAGTGKSGPLSPGDYKRKQNYRV